MRLLLLAATVLIGAELLSHDAYSQPRDSDPVPTGCVKDSSGNLRCDGTPVVPDNNDSGTKPCWPVPCCTTSTMKCKK